MVRIRMKVISVSSSKSDKVRMSFKVISRPGVKVNVKSRKTFRIMMKLRS